MIFKWVKSNEHVTYEEALAIRKAVFIDQQGIASDIELDGQDHLYYHVVGYEDNTPLCTARVKIEQGTLTVQRVAVMPNFQGQGIGRQLMNEIKRFSKEKHVTEITLSAQHTAVAFYQSLNYDLIEGSEHIDADILHFDMKLTL